MFNQISFHYDKNRQTQRMTSPRNAHISINHVFYDKMSSIGILLPGNIHTEYLLYTQWYLLS